MREFLTAKILTPRSVFLAFAPALTSVYGQIKRILSWSACLDRSTEHFITELDEKPNNREQVGWGRNRLQWAQQQDQVLQEESSLQQEPDEAAKCKEQENTRAAEMSFVSRISAFRDSNRSPRLLRPLPWTALNLPSPAPVLLPSSPSNQLHSHKTPI